MRTEPGKLIGYATSRLATRLRGLDHSEYLWEPVASDCCWSIGPDDDGRWRATLGPLGTTDAATSQPPVTTIAWRLWHLGASPDRLWPPAVSTGSELAQAWFTHPAPGTLAAYSSAEEACGRLIADWQAFTRAIDTFTDDEMATPVGPVGGPFSESPLLGLVLHIADELIHHGAEIALLRDLYANRP